MESNIVYVDVETTGLSPYDSRVVQIGLIYDGIEECYLINPQIPIPKTASDIHGITDDVVAEAATFIDLAPRLQKIFESATYFVAYNYTFDFSMLQAEFARTTGYFLDEKKFVFLDPMRIHKKLCPNTLSSLYYFYTGSPLASAHDALIDIKAAKTILDLQKVKFAEAFNQGLDHVSNLSSDKLGVLGKFFTEKDGAIVFAQGKHKGLVVAKEYVDYLRWILSLSDITLSERKFIEGKLNEYA